MNLRYFGSLFLAAATAFNTITSRPCAGGETPENVQTTTEPFEGFIHTDPQTTFLGTPDRFDPYFLRTLQRNAGALHEAGFKHIVLPFDLRTDDEIEQGALLPLPTENLAARLDGLRREIRQVEDNARMLSEPQFYQEHAQQIYGFFVMSAYKRHALQERLPNLLFYAFLENIPAELSNEEIYDMEYYFAPFASDPKDMLKEDAEYMSMGHIMVNLIMQARACGMKIHFSGIDDETLSPEERLEMSARAIQECTGGERALIYWPAQDLRRLEKIYELHTDHPARSVYIFNSPESFLKALEKGQPVPEYWVYAHRLQDDVHRLVAAENPTPPVPSLP